MTETRASLTVDSVSEPPALRHLAVARRLDALFRAMSTDYLLREQFVTDPADIAAEYVYGARPSPQRASIINQLVYSVMANGKLLDWLREYTIQFRGRPPTVCDPARGEAAFGARVAFDDKWLGNSEQ